MTSEQLRDEELFGLLWLSASTLVNSVMMYLYFMGKI